MSAQRTIITSSPMRSIFSHGIYILFLVCEKTMNEPQGGRIICVTLPVHISSSMSQIQPRTLPSRAFMTSFSRSLSNDRDMAQRRMQMSPPLPSLIIFSRVSDIFVRASSGMWLSFEVSPSLTSS